MKIITVETLKTFLDELNKKYGTEFYSKTESDNKYQAKGNYVALTKWNSTFKSNVSFYPDTNHQYTYIDCPDSTYFYFQKPLYGYLKTDEIANTYLRKTDAANTYLRQNYADNNYQTKGASYTKEESDSRYQTIEDANANLDAIAETYLEKNALEEIKNRLDTIEDIASTPTGSLVTYEQQNGLLGTIPERIQVIKVSCIESPKDFVFCGIRTGDRELSFSLEQTNSGVCLKLSNKNGQIETVTATINIMPHFKIEWSYEINRQTPTKFFN